MQAIFKSLVVLSFAGSTIILSAQAERTITLSVLAFDHYTSAPLEGVSVSLMRQGTVIDSTRTDLRGGAELAVLARGGGETQGPPQSFSVSRNYPNPFREATSVELGIPEEQTVELSIYTVLGQRVSAERSRLTAGYYTANLTLGHLSTGVYFLRVSGTASHTVKLLKIGDRVHPPGRILSIQPSPISQGMTPGHTAVEEYTVRVSKDRYETKEIEIQITGDMILEAPMERNNQVAFIVEDEEGEPLPYELKVTGSRLELPLVAPDTLILKSGIYTVSGSADTSKVSARIEIVSRDTTLVLTARRRTPVQVAVLHPGEFAELAGGLRLGVHPDATSEPLTIEVEWFDPADDPHFPVDLEWIRRLDSFVELRAEKGTDTPTGTGFLVAIPVPEDFDERHLYPLEYVYGIFSPQIPAHGNYWMPTGGIFDPEHRVFLLSIPALGGIDYPTRLGLVEHKTYETSKSVAILDIILDGTFDNSNRNHGLGLDNANSARLKPQVDSALDSPTVEFEVICKAADQDGYTYCHPWMKREVEEALYAAFEVYHQQLDGNPMPRLKRTVASWAPGVPVTYKYFIHNENTSVIPLIPDEEIGLIATCATGVLGFYVSVTGLGVTCDSGTDHATTTHHELFHAFQFGYHKPWTIGYPYLIEGTARLAENIDDPLGISRKETFPPIDVRLDDPISITDSETWSVGSGDFRPYRREYFFYDLFHRAGLKFEDMGRFLNEGLTTAGLDLFINKFTRFDGVGQAYWRWARNAAFEADIDPDGSYGDPCAFNEAAATPVDIAVAPRVTEETLAVFELGPLSSRVLEITLEAAAEPYHTSLAIVAQKPGINYKFYLPGEAHTDGCWSDDRDNKPQGFRVSDEKVRAYVLVANTNLDERSGSISLVSPPDFAWAKTVNQGDQTALALDRDRDYVYVTSSSYLSQYDYHGNRRWEQSASSLSSIKLEDISLTPSGEVLKTGTFGQNIRARLDTLWFSDDIYLVSTSAGGNGLLAKYDSEGTPLWARSIGGTGVSAQAIVADAGGNIYVAGQFTDSLKVEDTVLTIRPYHFSAYVARFDPDGNLVWIKHNTIQDVRRGNAFVFGIDVDAAGNVYATGQYSQIIIFDGVYLDSGGTVAKVFLVSYDPDGNVLYASDYGNDWRDPYNVSDIAVDDQGYAYLTGRYSEPGVGWQAYVAKFTPSGAIGWSKKAAGTGGNAGLGIELDETGSAVYVTGVFTESMILGGVELKTEGWMDEGFIARLSSAGQLSWTKTARSGKKLPLSIAVDQYGHHYISGRFFGTVQFDGFELRAPGGTITHSSVFLAKLGGEK